jgi:hypothetical protein
MSGNTEKQITNFLMPFDDTLVSLTQDLRKYLINETKPKYELVGDSTISLNIGYGFTKKAWDCFCAIIVYSKHINISFPSGVLLSDPQNLLQGSGSRIRHIKIKNVNDIKTQAVVNILNEARNNAFKLVEKDKPSGQILETIIIPIGGIKKRPLPKK